MRSVHDIDALSIGGLDTIALPDDDSYSRALTDLPELRQRNNHGHESRTGVVPAEGSSLTKLFIDNEWVDSSRRR